MSEAMQELIDHILAGTDDPNIVVGPLVQRDNTHYFIVAASERGVGFRCDQIVIEGGSGDKNRAALIADFNKAKG